MTTKPKYILDTLAPLWPNGDYVHNLYEGWCRVKPSKPGTYDGFRHAIKVLKDSGKIEEYRTESKRYNENPTWDRRYYRVTGR